MEHLERLTRKRLGEILTSEGLISKQQLDEAEREQARTGEPLGVILVDSSCLTDRDLARTIADQLQLPYLDITKVSVNPDLLQLFDLDDLVRHRVVPIDRLGKVVTLAVGEIPDMAVLRAMAKRTGLTPYLFIASLGDIHQRYAEQLEATGAIKEEATGHSLDLETVGESEGELVWNLEPEELKDGEWGDILDAANESVLREKGREE